MIENEKDSNAAYYWSARKVPPKIILYVSVVFIIFIAVSYFGFHSINAVKALAITALISILSFAPGIFNRIEYRLTKQALEYRPMKKKEQEPYKILFLLDQLSHIVQIENGFKYYLTLNESNPFRKFWKKYMSDKYSGAVNLEKADNKRILSTLDQFGISIQRKLSKGIN
jgi:hypothetical protein